MVESAERIVIVDQNDRVLGEEYKEKCHDAPGILHRGFLAMIFDVNGKLLLTRRSDTKRLWPGFWDGTIASHLFKGEDYEQASKRRLKEEIGIVTDHVQFAFKFEYRAEFGSKGTEHEICAVTLVRDYDATRIEPNRNEISDVRSIDPIVLRQEIRQDGEHYTPWLVLAIERMFKSIR